jgi:hypothetical protein
MKTTFGSARPLASLPDNDPIIGTKNLPTFGIFYSINHLRRMWGANKFPVPSKVSPNRLGWRRSTIQNWIEERTRSPEQ